MTPLRLPLFTILLLAPTLLHAGAWGFGSFANDDALDFVMML